MNILKFFQTCIVFFNIFLVASENKYNFVFYHEGSRISSYAEYALKQAAFFNPDADIYVLTDHKSLKYLKQWNLPNRIKAVDIASIEQSELQSKFIQKRKFSPTSPLDWFCFKRFFVLHDFIKKFNLRNTFLLENDNLIYADFSEFIDFIADNYQIGFTSLSKKFTICGISYFKGSSEVELLCNYINKNWDLKLVDMLFWPKFKADFPEIAIDLPSICEQEVTKQNIITYRDFRPSLHANEIGSLFDHAAYGQYFCGAFRTPPGYVNTHCCFNPSLMNLVWLTDDKERKCPYLISLTEGKRVFYRINNLHVHSKKLSEYISY
jgi:hypothetical protein